MKIRTIALMLTVVAVASLAAGQPAERVEVRLKAAMHQALVDGDLQAAIEQYADIVARAGGNRTVAAQALLQMGHAYEKLGSPGHALGPRRNDGVRLSLFQRDFVAPGASRS